MRPSLSPLVAAATVVALLPAARADEGKGAFPAWQGPAEPPLRDPWSVEPPELETAPFPLDARALELARAGSWGELVELLERGGAASAPGRGRGPGLPLLGPRELVRRRVLGLPTAARRAYEQLVEGRAKKLLAAPSEAREDALADLLARFGATPAAAVAARLLGERLLERGDVAGAALLWRRALGEARDAVLERRLVALRAALPYGVDGSLAAPAPPPGKPWGVLWARLAPGGDPLVPRAVAADGHRVFVTDHRGLVALERETGRLLWRAPLRGDPRRERLLVGHGRVVLLRRDRVVGVDAERGLVLWTRALPDGAGLPGGDRHLDAVATPVGFAVLASLDGRRRLLGVAPDGRTLFDAALWQERQGEGTRPIRRRVPADGPALDPEGRPLPAQFEDEGQAPGPVAPAYPVGLPGRRVVEDGRLAAVGDRVIIDADGVLAAASVVHGGFLWVRDKGPGLEVAGGRVLPAVGASAFAVEAVTAAGHLVRLDPLDGRALPPPAPPEGAWPDPPEPPAPGEEEAAPRAEWAPPRPYVLAVSPLVLAWAPDERRRTWLSAGCPARRLLPLQPLGPGAVTGQLLALPDPEGVVVVDLASGAELGDPLRWALAPGPLVVAGGLLVAAGPDGVVVYGPGGDVAVEDGPAPDDAVAALDAPDWRARRAARAALAARGGEAQGDLRRAAREAATLDGRDVARGLLERLERERVFSRLAPGMPRWLQNDLGAGVALVERLRTLRDLVPPGDKGSPDLERLFVEQDDPEVRSALLDLLLRVDGPLRRRVLATLCDPGADDDLRAACALALVELVARGGPAEALRRVAQDEDLDEGTWAALVQAVQAQGDPELLQELMPRRTFARAPQAKEASLEAGRAKLLEALPRLLDER